MLRKYCVSLIISIALVNLMLCNIAYAADSLYRFMHNDHDALIVGEITNIDENDAHVKVVKTLVSAKNLNENHPKKQLKLSEATVMFPFDYVSFYNEDGSYTVDPSVGDYVLLSLNQAGHNFKIAWGAYKVTSLDYKKLSVALPENPEIWSRMDAAAIKVFVNSDGQTTEFAFDEDSKTVYAGEGKAVIFNENTFKDENQIRESSSIIGGSDGPTSIYVTGDSIKDMIIPIIIFAVIIFAGGFVIGYIFKARRPK